MFCFVLRIPHPFSKLAYVNSWPPLGTHCAEVLIITSKLYKPWNIFATLNWQRQSQMKTKKCENTQIRWQTYFYTATTWSMAWQVAQKLRGPRPSTQKWKHSTAQQDNMAGTHKWKWSVPRCQLGHVANTKDTRWTWWKKQGGGSEWWWTVPTWVSKRYAGDGAQIDALSVRCPMQLGLKRAGRKGHWACAQDSLTHICTLGNANTYSEIHLRSTVLKLACECQWF